MEFSSHHHQMDQNQIIVQFDLFTAALCLDYYSSTGYHYL